MLPKTAYSRVDYNSPRLFIHTSGERQKRPFDLMCQLWSNFIRVTQHSSSLGRDPPDVSGYPSVGMRFKPPGLETAVANLSYKRMVGKLGDSASLGATLTAERRETWGMVVTAVTRCLSAARNVRKLQFGRAARDLGLPYRERSVVKRMRYVDSRGRKKVLSVRRKEFQWMSGKWYSKELGSGWLMYSYGVAPLMGDIKSSMDTLHSEFPRKRIFGYAEDSGTVVDAPWGPQKKDTYTTKIAYRQSVEVWVTNPNLYLAGRLGLVNPAQWALEAIPLSFIADWFSNLSDVVNSMTDFVGVNTANPCVNRRYVQTRVGTHTYAWYDTNSYTTIWESKHRDLSLVTPKFQVAYERFQWQRGANAISLLLQALKTRQ